MLTCIMAFLFILAAHWNIQIHLLNMAFLMIFVVILDIAWYGTISKWMVE